MKLASLRDGTRDGRLLVVSRDLTQAVLAPYATLQAALDDWDEAEPQLQMASEAVAYTHLRAHETVLDHVCRLLLEKKKTLLDHLV